MLAKVVHGTLRERHLEASALAVRDRLAPDFAAQAGALQGYWLLDRSSGLMLIVTLWRDGRALDAARAHDGTARATVADGIGLSVHAVETMVVVGHDADSGDVDVGPVWRWVRATWISGSADHAAALPGLHRATLPHQARDAGFRGSFWLADESIRSGVALSFWDGPDALSGSEHTSRLRRRRLQRRFGFTVDRIHSYEGVAIVTDDRRPGRQWAGDVDRDPTGASRAHPAPATGA